MQIFDGGRKKDCNITFFLNKPSYFWAPVIHFVVNELVRVGHQRKDQSGKSHQKNIQRLILSKLSNDRNEDIFSLKNCWVIFVWLLFVFLFFHFCPDFCIIALALIWDRHFCKPTFTLSQLVVLQFLVAALWTFVNVWKCSKARIC